MLVILLVTSFFFSAQSHAFLYDPHKNFYENAAQGPLFSAEIPVVRRSRQTIPIDFLGYTLASPLGVPACASMTSKGIALLAQLGFDVLTYKTIRCKQYPGHPLPNLFFIEQQEQCTLEDIGKPVTISASQDTPTFALANSFGNASFDALILKDDIKRAKASLHDGQVMIVSVYGETKEEFVEAALLAVDAGADVIEANFSCPNFCNALVYLDAEKVAEISRELVAAQPLPVIMKVGVFPDINSMRAVLKAAAAASIRGVCGINSLPMRVIDAQGNPAFGSTRAIAGVSGKPLKNLTLDFIRSAKKIITQEKLDLIILATGGAVEAVHFKEFLDAGAMIAMSATGTMYNPLIAMEYHNSAHD